MKELNAYELPEILGFPAKFADTAFAAWVAESSSGVAATEEEERFAG